MPKDFRIMLLPGDGIGPEIIREAIKVLDVVSGKFDCTFEYGEALVGGASIDAIGRPITEEVLTASQAADAVLLGAVGGPEWDNVDPSIRPEKALFALRKGLGLFANIRPVSPRPSLLSASTLRPEVLEGVDLVVVRELTGGLYFGEPRYRRILEDGDELAVDTLTYTAKEIRRIAEKAFEMAGLRRRKVTSVDKANVLDSSRLWRQTVEEVAKGYPGIALEHMLVDNCAMQLVRNPRQFDVIVTENLFGDILSDEAAMLTGSIGMLPSSSLGTGGSAMYEPIHGSAPDIAGQDKANPIATILSAAMMLEYSFGMTEAARAIGNAVDSVLAKGYRTGDLMEPGAVLVGTGEMGSRVAQAIV